MVHIYPDIDWYTSRSHDKKLAPRCPYANVHWCPRYYQSYALLGKSGITTSLAPDDDAALMAKWKKADLWPAVAEHATSISGSDEKKSQFSNFCPEVTFDTFGLFAASLCRYTDELDRETTETWLVNQGLAFAKDWRWEWASVCPMHYSECPLYSQLAALQLADKVPTRTEDDLLGLFPSQASPVNNGTFQKILKIWNDPVWSKVIATAIISIVTVVVGYFWFSKSETKIPGKISVPSEVDRTEQDNNTKKDNSASSSININRSNNVTINQTQNVKTADINAATRRLKEALKSLDLIESYMYYSIDYEPDQYQSRLSRARIEIRNIHDIKGRTHDLILNTYDCYHESGEIWKENSPSALLTKGVTSLYDEAKNQFHKDTLPTLRLKWKECSAFLSKAHEYSEIER